MILIFLLLLLLLLHKFHEKNFRPFWRYQKSSSREKDVHVHSLQDLWENYNFQEFSRG